MFKLGTFTITEDRQKWEPKAMLLSSGIRNLKWDGWMLVKYKGPVTAQWHKGKPQYDVYWYKTRPKQQGRVIEVTQGIAHSNQIALTDQP